MSSDLCRLIETYKYTKFIIGTQKIKICKGTVVEMGLLYKIYSWFLGLVLPAIIFTHVIQFIKNSLGKFIITMFIVIILTHSTLATFHIMSTISKSKFFKNIVQGIIEFDNILNIQNIKKPFLYPKLCLVLIFYIVLKIFQIFYDYLSWDSPSYILIVPFYLISCIMEIEVGYFVVETNILARRFEILNELLKNYGTNKLHMTKMHIETDFGILHRIWENKNGNLEKFHCSDLYRFMKAYKILVDVTKEMSNYYGLTV